MRKHILTTIALLPLLLNLSQAAQRWTVEPSQPFGIPSEESGTSSYLGVDIVDITSDRLGALKLKEEQGVEVTMVDQDAPAGKAGLKEQDVILSLNGSDVQSVEQLRRMIRETPPGRVVTLGVSRGGQMMTIKVELADRKKNYSYNSGPDGKRFKFNMPTMPAMPVLPDMDLPVSIVVVHSSARSGLMVENLTPQLGDFFGAKNGQGVLVRSVEKGSSADKAGFRAGDVIVKINGEPIHDSGDFSHALRSRKDNTASNGVASVSGGGFNIASGYEASVSGGNLNEAIGLASSISGGGLNRASGAEASWIGGGFLNEVFSNGVPGEEGLRASIFGGELEKTAINGAHKP